MRMNFILNFNSKFRTSCARRVVLICHTEKRNKEIKKYKRDIREKKYHVVYIQILI